MHASPGFPEPTAPAPLETDSARLFEHSLDLLCISGLDGYFRQVNPSWTRVLGWSREELLSRPVADFMHPDDRERTLQARRDLARGIPVRNFENRYLCKNGSYRWLSWQSSIKPGETTVFAVARDITEQRQAEHERLVSSKIESTGLLAGGIAHDFNNLLASLLLNLEMVSLSGPLSPPQNLHLRQARDTIQAAKTLTQQLLAFAQSGVGARRVTDLRDLLRESLTLALGGSNILGESDIAPDLWPTDVDSAQIGQVIRNLVLNARESMPAGGTVRLDAANIKLPTDPALKVPAGDYVRIRVGDQGAGIPADTLPDIFTPYFSTKQRGSQKGMGLGLTICHSVLQKHGGVLEVNSTPGVGTTVDCLLPATRTARVAPPARVESPILDRARKILVMDDDPSLLEIVSHFLTHLGHHVVGAADGAAAINQCRSALAARAPFHVALLDLTVRGGMGGAEAFLALRALDPALPVILMTGYNDEQSIRDHLERGFSSALAKPFSTETLRKTLARVLEGNG